MSKTTVENEIWKDITGFEGEYQVSNLGRVRHASEYTKGHRNPDGMLSQSLSYGKPSVALRHRNSRTLYRRSVAYLVASHFLPNPDNCKVTKYIDGNVYNNRVDNLQWVKRSNIALAAVGKAQGYPCRCIETGEIYPSVAYAARATGLSNSGILNAIRNQTKTRGGFTFEFVDKDSFDYDALLGD
jgi:hypothetical protein